MEIEEKAGLCGICPSGCAVIVRLKNGRLDDIKADTSNPQGGLCVRGKAAREIIYSPDRLTKPLIRCGERGEGKFRPATWEESLDLIAASMDSIKSRFGAEAMVYYYGRGVFEQAMKDNYQDWLLNFGSPNVCGDGSLCAFSSNVFAPVPTLGLNGLNLKPDIGHSNSIVVWGKNPLASSPPFVSKEFINAKRRGAKIIVIDQMLSDTAKIANEWIPIRAGTDGALALGLIREVIQENLYDKDLAEKWTLGLEELKGYVKQFTPQAVEQITNVPSEKVRELAREIATTPKVSLVKFTGLEYTNSGVQNIRAVNILWALAGHLDEQGGLVINKPSLSTAKKNKVKHPGIKPFGAEEYPLYYEYTGEAQYVKFPDAVMSGKPYPLKGLILHGAATLANYPEPSRFAQAYSELDLMVVIDRFPVADIAFADVVLPATTYFEIYSYRYFQNYLRLREKLIDPIGQCRNDCLILSNLAEKLGYGHLYPKSEEELVENVFEHEEGLLDKLKNNPSGITINENSQGYKKWENGKLRPDKQKGFNTPSGKIEIKSSILAEFGYDALPVYKNPLEGPLEKPGLYKKYPLVLSTGARFVSGYHSQHFNIPGLLKLHPKPVVIMNYTDAEARGIKNGDAVIVRSPHGQLRLWASVGKRIPPGGVEVNKGGGNPYQAPEWRNSNVNYLTDLDNCDPISGFPVLKALLCEVEKI